MNALPNFPGVEFQSLVEEESEEGRSSSLSWIFVRMTLLKRPRKDSWLEA